MIARIAATILYAGALGCATVEPADAALRLPGARLTGSQWEGVNHLATVLAVVAMVFIVRRGVRAAAFGWALGIAFAIVFVRGREGPSPGSIWPTVVFAAGVTTLLALGLDALIGRPVKRPEAG